LNPALLACLVLTDTATIAPTGQESASVERLEHGTHWRLLTERGVVHVFRPRGYRLESAGTLIYLHGYYTHVDRAIEEHRLLDQFTASRQNAQFLVPEAPAGKKEPVFFPDLGALLATTSRLTNRKIPDGPVVVLAHSGAYRTVAEWLGHRRLDEVILLDALYAHESDFSDWIRTVPRHAAHKLLVVSVETEERSEKMVSAFPLAAKRTEVPQRFEGFSPNERASQLLHVSSKIDHMTLVTGQEVIPVLLRLTPFERL
jgi:hypothetical protein